MALSNKSPTPNLKPNLNEPTPELLPYSKDEEYLSLFSTSLPVQVFERAHPIKVQNRGKRMSEPVLTVLNEHAILNRDLLLQVTTCIIIIIIICLILSIT